MVESTSPFPDIMNTNNPGVARQIVASAIVSLVCINSGMTQGWQSPMSLILTSEDSPVEVMTNVEISMLASIPMYVTLILAFPFSYIAQLYGRKFTLIVLGVPSIISGVALTFAPSKEWLYVGKALAGCINKAMAIAAMYISETAHHSIRGAMISMAMMTINIGILSSYVFGKLLSYKVFNSLLIAIPTVFTVLVFWLPESPHFLIEKSKLNEAERSFLWLRGGDEIVAKHELEIVISSKAGQQEMLTFVQVLKSKVTRTALIVSVFSYVLQALSGIQAVLNYSGLVYKEAGSPLSPGNSSILTASLILGATFTNLFLIDKFGRKPLLYLSFIGGSLSLSCLSVFLYLQMKGTDVSEFGWLPIACLSAYVVLYGLGLAAVPGVLQNEVSPTNIKPVVSAVTVICVFGAAILVIQSFPFLDENIGLYSAFAFPAFFNVVGVFFNRFVVFETKGKPLTQIINEIEAR